VLGADPTETPPPLPPKPSAKSASPRSRELTSSVVVAAIGGIIFLLGAIYGLTVSIQRGWISPLVRVLIGIGAGGAIAFGGIRLIHQQRRKLGLTVEAVGLGTAVFACYYGGVVSHVIPTSMGFMGAMVATVVAGWTATRYHMSGAMVAAVGLALLTPELMWEGARPSELMLVYLLAIVVAQGIVYYTARTGAKWHLARWVGTTGTALFALGYLHFRATDSLAMSWVMLAVLYAVLLVIVWLPRHPERPGTLLGLTAAVSILLGFNFAHAHSVHDLAAWDAVPLAGQALVLLGLIPLARRRLGNDSMDAGLAVLAAGFAAVALCVALESRGTLLMWATIALAGAVLTTVGPAREKTALRSATLLYLAIATIIWVVEVTEPIGPDSMPFFNSTWLGSALVCLGWLVFTRTLQQTPLVATSFTFGQIVGVHGIAAELAGRQLMFTHHGAAGSTLPSTFTYAVAGLVQWYASVRLPVSDRTRILGVLGYFWIGLAVIKLFFVDLAQASLESRAIAALILGALFIGAALMANRLKPTESNKAPADRE
jgi:hypothetical protein